MAKKRRIRVLGGIVVVLLVVVTIHIVRHPWWPYCVRTVIDANSGDLARRTYVCDCKVGETIEETAFSREVRRRGVAAAKGRHWRSAGGRYGYLLGHCKAMAWMMDALKMADMERSALLAETLAIVQTEDADWKSLVDMRTRLGKKLRQLTEREIEARAGRRAAVARKIQDHYESSDCRFEVRGPYRLATLERDLVQPHEESARIKGKTHSTVQSFADSTADRTCARFKNEHRPGDELYFFTSAPNSCDNLMTTEGYVLIRQSELVDLAVTRTY